MDAYEVLRTTRAMRRLKPDPIPLDAQARILDAAIRAPTASNSQNWRFILVDDPDLKARLAPLYQQCVAEAHGGFYAEQIRHAKAHPEDPQGAALLRTVRAVNYQAKNWASIPLFLFAFAQGKRSGSSIYPAVWSAQLAARAEGIGSTLTTMLARRPEAPAILGMPEDEGWVLYACVPMGYPLGRFVVPTRRPIEDVAARNGWNGPLGFEAAR